MVCMQTDPPVQQLMTDLQVFSGFSASPRSAFDTDSKQGKNAKTAGQEKNITFTLQTPFINLLTYYATPIQVMKPKQSCCHILCLLAKPAPSFPFFLVNIHTLLLPPTALHTQHLLSNLKYNFYN